MGSPAGLREAYGGEGVEFTAHDRIDCVMLGTRLGAHVRPVRVDRYRVEAEPTTELLGLLVQTLTDLGVEAQDVATVSPSLEEIYLSLIAATSPGTGSLNPASHESSTTAPPIPPAQTRTDHHIQTSTEETRG